MQCSQNRGDPQNSFGIYKSIPELGCVCESRSALLRTQLASISSLLCLAKSLFFFFVSERLLDFPVRPKHPMAKSTKVEQIVIFAYGGRKEGREGKGYGKEGRREKEERAKVRERETLVFELL